MNGSDVIRKLERVLRELSEVKGQMEDDNAVTRAHLAMALVDVYDALETQRSRVKRPEKDVGEVRLKNINTVYKEPRLNPQGAAQMAKRIEQATEKTAAKVADVTQSDESFTSNLYDLCVLNRMAESHEKPEGGK